MSYNFTPEQGQRIYRSNTTGIISDTRNILEIDPGDDTKIKVKAPYTLVTVDVSVPSAITESKMEVPITAGIVHNIPPGFTYWIGVKDDGTGQPEYEYHFTLEEYDLTVFGILGKAFTDEVVPLQLSSVFGNFWWFGYNFGKTLYDFANSRATSFRIADGGVTLTPGTLLYTREAGIFWRFMGYNSLSEPNKGLDPQTAVTQYFTYSSSGPFEDLPAFEVGFIDDGAGGKTAIGADQWSIYKVYHYGSSNFEGAQRGKQAYNSLNEAQTRQGEEDTEVNPDNTNAAFTHIAFVKGDATDITNTEQVVFQAVDNLLSSSGDPLVASLNESGIVSWTNPDILTINGGDAATFDTVEFRIGSVDRTGDIIRFIRTVPATTGNTLPDISNNPFSYIAYNISTKALITSKEPFTRIVLDNEIPIGRLWHRNNLVIDSAQTMPMVNETSHDYAGQLLAFSALRQDNVLLTPNGTNLKVDMVDFVLEVLGGTSTNRNLVNIAQPAGGVGFSFTPVHRSAGQGKVVFDTVVSDIDFTVFDDGSGTLAPLSNNTQFGIHYFCIFPFRTSFDVFLIRADREYGTLLDAQAGLSTNPITPFTDFDGGLCFGAVVGRKNTLDITAGIAGDYVSIHGSNRFGSFGA